MLCYITDFTRKENMLHNKVILQTIQYFSLVHVKSYCCGNSGFIFEKWKVFFFFFKGVTIYSVEIGEST